MLRVWEGSAIVLGYMGGVDDGGELIGEPCIGEGEGRKGRRWWYVMEGHDHG